MRRGKKYQEALKKIGENQAYLPEEALRLVKEARVANFDETVELHVRLGIDPRQADQQVRGSINLPAGTGKKVRVIVFASGEKAKEAKEAGAIEVGGEDLAKKIEGGWLDFEAVVATPDMMRVVSRLGKILGPRGLMPNPKTGTVTNEVGKVVGELQKGRIEYRSDKFGLIHLPIGKVSFSEKDLLQNYLTVMNELVRAKPAAARGRYIKSVTISSTMGPGIKIDPTRFLEVSEEEAIA
jgi:large subunit ribosomal protein L1